MRLIRVPVALLLTLSMPGLALAQVPPPPSGPATQPQPQPQPQPTTQPSTQPTTQPTDLTEDQKIELAKQKYMEAEQMAAQGRWAEATGLYEEAYYLVPGKHGFAHKVGVSAWNASDCNKANTYLKHFLQYGDPEKHGDKIDEAKQILGEISVSGCATQAATTTTTTTDTSSEPIDNENPLGDSSTEMRQEEAKKAREAKKQEKRGLLIGGAVLTGFGVAGVAAGAIGLGLASGAANNLTDLSTNNTITGFPLGDYACRDSDAGCPQDLEGRMKGGNITGYVGFGLGGAMLVAGAAMLAIYFVNKKKSGGALESEAQPELTGLGPVLLPGGGGGAMAEIRF